MTRSDIMLAALWIGLPFALVLFLLLINPAYEARIFEQFGPVSGFTILIGIQLLNTVVLFVGLTSYKRQWVRAAILAATFIVFVLPALWVALMFPSIMFLMDTPPTGL